MENSISKNSKLIYCSNCKKLVTPQVVFYQKEPECSICPQCSFKFKKYKNSSKIEDRLLLKIVSFSIVLYFIALLVRF